MWLIVLSLSLPSLHLLFCWVLSILALIWLVLTALPCAAIWRDSVSLLKFPFLSHIQVLSCEILFISHLLLLLSLLLLLYRYLVDFTGVWVTLSVLKSPGLFSIFWPISIILLFGWSRFVLRFQTLPPPFPNLRGQFKVHQIQMVSSSHSYSTAFLVLSQCPSTYKSLCLLSLSFPRGPLERQIQHYCKFFLFVIGIKWQWVSWKIYNSR